MIIYAIAIEEYCEIEPKPHHRAVKTPLDVQ